MPTRRCLKTPPIDDQMVTSGSDNNRTLLIDAILIIAFVPPNVVVTVALHLHERCVALLKKNRFCGRGRQPGRRQKTLVEGRRC